MHNTNPTQLGSPEDPVPSVSTDSPPAASPESPNRPAVPSHSGERTPKRLTIADQEVSQTHIVPAPTPLKECPAPGMSRRGSHQPLAGTPPATRVGRGRRSLPSSPVPKGTPDSHRASSPHPATGGADGAGRSRSSSSLSSPLVAMADTQQWPPKHTAATSTGRAPTAATEAAADGDDMTRGSSAALSWSFFAQRMTTTTTTARTSAEEADPSAFSSSSLSSDNSARTYGQRSAQREARRRATPTLMRGTSARGAASRRRANQSPHDQTVVMALPRTSSHSDDDDADVWGTDVVTSEDDDDVDMKLPSRAAHGHTANSPRVQRVRRQRKQKRSQFHDHWTLVLLAVTSAIILLVVVALLLALYRMTLPYWRSIWSSVLLSIVLHPQSRLRHSLYKGTCTHRMARLRRHWARRGRVFALVGAWCSLAPFASFVVMQGVFFLGLNKVERRVFVDVSVPTHDGRQDAGARPSTPGGGPATHRSGPSLADTLRLPDSSALHWGADEALSAEQATKTPRHAPSAVPSRGAPATTRPVLQRQRIVATVGGRRVPRVALVAIVMALAHLLVGIRYFLLLHVGLLIVFALAVPVLPPHRFLTLMSRVWRFAVALFLILGLASNFVQDVRAVSHAVSRTASELVATRAGTVNRTVAEIPFVSPSDGASSTDPHDTAAQSAEPSSLADLWGLYKDNVSQWIRSYVVSSGLEFPGEGDVDRPPIHIGALSNASTVDDHAGWSVQAMWSAWFHKNLTRTIVYSAVGEPEVTAGTDTSSPLGGGGGGAAEVDWWGVGERLAQKLWPLASYVVPVLSSLYGNVINFFDSIYGLMLFVFFFRYLTSLEHTVLYYAIAKVLRPLQPEYGEVQARRIEQDITASFITLLQSFWHLTWFHFSTTFCVFKWFELPTPFLFGTVSVTLSIFPLVPKWMSPCAVALVVCAVSRFNEGGVIGAALDGRVIALLISTLVDMSDEWLLCVSRSIRGNFITDAAGFEQEQLHPFVVGTALVLGFVSWGAGGIVLGPLTVIVAKVIYDSWDRLLLTPHDTEAAS